MLYALVKSSLHYKQRPVNNCIYTLHKYTLLHTGVTGATWDMTHLYYLLFCFSALSIASGFVPAQRVFKCKLQLFTDWSLVTCSLNLSFSKLQLTTLSKCPIIECCDCLLVSCATGQTLKLIIAVRCEWFGLSVIKTLSWFVLSEVYKTLSMFL